MNEHDLMCSAIEAAEQLVATGQLIPGSYEAADLLTALETRLKNLRSYQSGADETDRPAGVNLRVCDKCECRFFFARDSPDDDVFGRWVPFELEPINADGVLPSWLWVIDFTGPHPMCKLEPTRTSGQVYVDHRQTCGGGKGPKHRCAPYLRRYKVNFERATRELQTQTAETTASLQSLRRRLNQQGPDVDS